MRNKGIIHFNKNITLFHIGSIDKGETMTSTGLGIYYLQTTTDMIPIKMIYSEPASETIVLPTDVVAYDQQFDLEE